MTTYRLPREPDGPVWKWSRTSHSWLKYVKRYEDCWVCGDRTGVQTGKSWGELLGGNGDVTDLEPITESLDELRDAIVSAAVVWHMSPTPATELLMRDAVGLYNRKRHQVSDEQQLTDNEREGDV